MKSPQKHTTARHLRLSPTAKHLALALCCALPASFSSCIDKEYDLSHLDGTISIPVNNLVLPVNLDAITLKDMLKEGDRIKIVDGVYTVCDEGRVTSADVFVRKFNVTAPVIEPVSVTVSPASGFFSSSQPGGASFGYLPVYFSQSPATFSYTSEDVPSSIITIDDIKGDVSASISVNFPQNLLSVAEDVAITNVRIQMPKGLIEASGNFTSYDPATGILTIDRITHDSPKISVKAKGIDMRTLGYEFDASTRIFSVSTQIGILEGYLYFNPSNYSEVPDTSTIGFNYAVDGINVSSFSGDINYTVDRFNIPSVDFGSLPSLLSQPGTDIRLVNPCIYLQLNNPLQEYGLYAQTGIKIQATRRNESTKTYTLDNPVMTICKGNPANGLYNYCLSPEMPEHPDSSFPDAEHVGFSQLGDILSGNGLPNSLRFTVEDPVIPTLHVKDFKLGYNYGSIDGRYKLVAPLALENGSLIAYGDSYTGWGDGDIEHITITSLELTADVSNDLPLDLDFTACPLTYGERPISGVTVTGASLKGGQKDQKLHIRIDGEIKDLDGMRFEATCVSTSPEAIAPDMKIVLKNIRVTASGNYNDKL